MLNVLYFVINNNIRSFNIVVHWRITTTVINENRDLIFWLTS